MWKIDSDGKRAVHCDECDLRAETERICIQPQYNVVKWTPAAVNSEYGDIIWLHETLETFDTEATARAFIRKTVENLNAKEINHGLQEL